MLTVAFGESTMSRTQVQLWCNRFKDGRKNVNDDARPGRSNTSTIDENIETVKKMTLDNCRITIREVADDVGISFGWCPAIFSEVLGMKRATAKVVSKLHKQRRMDIAYRSTTIQICSKRS